MSTKQTDEGKISNPEGRILFDNMLLIQPHFFGKRKRIQWEKPFDRRSFFSIYTSFKKCYYLYFVKIKRVLYYTF